METGDIAQYSLKDISLKDTIQEQRQYSKSLKARPIEEVFRPLKERTEVDLLAVRGEKQDYNGEAKKEPPENLKPYFDSEAKDRKYYLYNWWDDKYKEQVCYLAVEEDQVGGNPDLYALAVFYVPSKDKPDEVYYYKNGEEIRLPFLYLERLYLVNENTNKAIDLASSWWGLPVDKKDPQIKAEGRLIGLYPQNRKMSKEEQQAVVTTNIIVVSDTQSNKPWSFVSSMGERVFPSLSPWIVYGLAGAEATQKRRDISFPEVTKNKIKDTLLKTIPQEEVEKILPFLTSDEILARVLDEDEIRRVMVDFIPTEKIETVVKQIAKIKETGLLSFFTHDDVLRRVVRNLLKYQGQAKPDMDIIDKLAIVAPQAQLERDYIEQLGLVIIIRRMRNAMAVMFRFLDHLRWQGFDLTGGLSFHQLRNERRRILKYFDNLYKQGLEELKISTTFSFGDRKTRGVEEKE